MKGDHTERDLWWHLSLSSHVGSPKGHSGSPGLHPRKRGPHQRTACGGLCPAEADKHALLISGSNIFKVVL